ncbi:hypothetical protein [European catfish virus]|uniref:Uncharacterized protein n=1 Tax=European catfish virus TaxID=84739 RepID=I2BFR0_9VIRU|nr:hypothetical protein A190_gp080 [European catfish virus]AFJ52363.1 hypothetical protein [European catfish virus]AMZ04909.1 hypothetical protein [European catfish virus]AMZ05045.1 hypothetical protein [European catfish virus]
MYSFRRCILSEDVFFQKMYSFRRCILSEDVFFQKMYSFRRCILSEDVFFQKMYSFRGIFSSLKTLQWFSKSLKGDWKLYITYLWSL